MQKEAMGYTIPIGHAKEKVKRAVSAYLRKGKGGNYIIPKVNQIPLYLFGAPGIGKTAAAHQAAEELGVGFVSFSLTHLTRNSLLGLPVISELNGIRYTEFTMSEIIAEVVKAESRGFKEGILLLDEFNCVSETIMPVMLEFLQTGNIGTHKLPEGWILVLCGNPTEYNRSAREFDAAVIDRVRRIEVYAETEDFRDYADAKKLHPVIREFLEICPDCLYDVSGYDRSTERRDVEVVTPRGWENLSWALYAYEEAGFEVDEELTHQYLKSERIAHQFFRYYCQKLNGFSKKEADEILQGKDHELYAKQLDERSAAFRFGIIELLAQRLDSGEGSDEEVSRRISNAFGFVQRLKEKGKLEELLAAKINDSVRLMSVLMEVQNDDYLKICGRAFGVYSESKIA